jgi:uncharacterized membrane protein YphA (DoxX/SURF4 family)
MISHSKAVKIIRILLGATFILSALAKIVSLNFFDELVAKQLIGDDFLNKLDQFYWVQWLTRVLIAGEFMLGVAVLQERFLKSITLPVMIGLLVAFTCQVIFEAEVHNKGYIGGNCGCFGDIIPFDNLQTIIKNIVLVAMAWYVFKFYKENKEMNVPPVLIPFIVGIVCLFTLSRTFKKIEPVADIVDLSQFNAPIDSTETPTLNDSLIDSLKIDTASLLQIKDTSKKAMEVKKPSIFDNYRNFSGGVVKDLEQGTQLVCLFSFTCSHCQQTFKDILELKKKGGKFGDVYIIGYGTAFDEKNFWSITGGKTHFIRIEDYSEFQKLLQGDSFPKIFVKKKGVTKKIWNIDTYSREAMFKYFGVDSNLDKNLPKNNGGIIIEKPADDLIIEDKKDGGNFWD